MMLRYGRKRFFLLGILVTCLFLAIAIRPDIPAAELRPLYAPTPSRFITVGHDTVHIRDQGKGPVLLLLHGTSASLHTWEGWVDRLRDNYRVISIDLPAFGLTGPISSGDYSIQGYALFLDRLLSTLKIDRASIVGNSLGGQIAWYYAATRPERVDRLILIDAAGYARTYPFIFRVARVPVIGDFLAYVTPRWLIRQNLRAVYGDPSKISDDLITRYWQLARASGNREALLKRLRTGRQNPDIQLVEQIEARALVLWGEEDSWIPPSHAKKFVADIPHAVLRIMPGLGHVPMEEDPEATAAVARDFLAGRLDEDLPTE